MEEHKLFEDFVKFIEDHNGVVNHQLDDTPYSVGIFQCGNRLFSITYGEDTEDYWREEYEKHKEAA